MASDPLNGSWLGQYQVLEALGEGGMARVYKAMHPRLRRLVALKIILPEAAARPGFQDRFEREAQLIARLQHANIVTVYDFGEANSLAYLVMQYVGGGTLSQKLRGGQLLPISQAISYTIQMAKALHHAHLQGIIHRDIKPSNMLLDERDPTHLLLSDFGIAKLLYNAATSDPGQVDLQPITTTGNIVGTPEFMAPEQASAERIDARSDIYSLGIVLYLLLTGKLPFRADTPLGVLYQQVNVQPPSVSQINQAVQPNLAAVVATALAKRPEERFQSADAFARALEDVMLSASQIDASPTLLVQPGRTVIAPGGGPGVSGALGASPPTPVLTQPASPNTPPPGVITASTTPTQIRPSQADGFQYNQGANRISDPANLPGYYPVQTPPPVERPPIFTPVVERPRRNMPWAATAASLVVALVLVLLLVVPGSPLAGLLKGGGNGSPTPSATATATPAPISTPVTDNFINNSLIWPEGNINGDPGLNWKLGSGRYRILIAPGDKYNLSYPVIPKQLGTAPANFTLEIKVAQTKGSDILGFGLIVHEFEDKNMVVHGYAFTIDSKGGYEYVKYPTTVTSARFTDSPAVQSGPNQINDLMVVAKGSTYTFYANGQLLPLGLNGAPSVTDSDYTGGAVGLLVTGPDTEFEFTSFAVTPMP